MVCVMLTFCESLPLARFLHRGSLRCRFICISHSGLKDRGGLLMDAHLPWKLLEHVELQKNKAVFYAYVMQKPWPQSIV